MVAQNAYRAKVQPKPKFYRLTLELIPRNHQDLPVTTTILEVTVSCPPSLQDERRHIELAGLSFWSWRVLSRRLDAI